MAGTDEVFRWIREDLTSKGIPEGDASELAQCEAYGGRWGEKVIGVEGMQRWKELRAKYAHILGGEGEEEADQPIIQ